jgi:hypothetical protein
MKRKISVLKITLAIGMLLLFAAALSAQTLKKAQVMRNAQGELRKIQFNFSARVDNIVDANVFGLENGESLSLGAPKALNPPSVILNNIYETESDAPLETKTLPNGKLALKDYIFAVKIVAANGKQVWQNIKIILPDPTTATQSIVEEKADAIEDSAFYIDGEMRGSFKKKTRFSTNIKLKRLTQKGRWIYTTSPLGFLPVPLYFKLSANTDPTADPDSMEIGFNFARVVGTHFYWDNEVKLESQRDFKNTNFIFSSRGSYRPAGISVTKKNGDATSILFFRPFIGTEVGKNLRSPLDAAEGDGIARVLAGADLRLNVPIDFENGKEINWTTSYVRRWLLTDELGFKPDAAGNLQLLRFGKSPRDYFKSKADFSFNKFVGAFVEYEWGQQPPSYKFLDHKFRLGLFYKFKFAVK